MKRSGRPEQSRGEHIQARKSLGQNFLTDRNIARKIVAALDLNRGDSVLEIGPGEGALSRLILQQPGVHLSAIEIDRRAVELLNRTFPQERFPQFRLVEGDALKLNWADIPGSDNVESRFKLVGNIPYYITGPLLFRALDHAEVLDRAVIMMQREVAKRIVAAPRSKDYGILTVATALRGRAKMLFDVAPGCFVPRPNVRSAVVLFDFSEPPLCPPQQYKTVKQLVDAAFNQRRKMLSNALERHINSRCKITVRELTDKHPDLEAVLKKRAEELSPADFIELDRQLSAAAEEGRHASGD